MYLTANEVQAKYGISHGHCRRDLVEFGKCRTKSRIFCGRECLSYYEPDIIKYLEVKEERKKRAAQRYENRPITMSGKKSKYSKTLPRKMYIKLRNAWFGMMRRCYTTDRPDYQHYRNVKVRMCDEWLNDFDAFASWSLENGAEMGLSLDRIDNNGIYSPDNCRWTVKRVQANNTSTNDYIAYDGRTQTIADWAKEYKIPYFRLYSRIMKGWDMKKCLEQPRKKAANANTHTMTINGETRTLSEWAKIAGLEYHLVYSRFAAGWPPEDVISGNNFRLTPHSDPHS